MFFGVFGRRHDAVPGDRLETRQRFGDRRHVRQRRQAVGEATASNFSLPACNQRQRDAEIVEHQVDVASDQALQRRRRAAIGNVAQLDLCHQLKQFGGQMRGRAVALRGGR